MVDVVLGPTEGVVTHEVFAAGEDDPDEAAAGSEDEENPKEKAPKDILDTFKHSYVKEVVRDERMHF